MKRIKPAYIIAAAVLIVAVGFIIVQSSTKNPGARSVEDDSVTVTIGAVETNATLFYQIKLLEGSDPEHEVQHVFETLADLPGVGDVSLDMQTLELAVTYDDAVIADPPIRERLLEAGYLVPSAEDAVPTEVAEDGSVQRIAVADDGTQFDPYLIRATPGVPIEIEFSPGTECRTVVKFPQIGVEQDISQGGTVALPALEPGEYQIACGGDAHEGALIVEEM
jgi:hypothetical protein